MSLLRGGGAGAVEVTLTIPASTITEADVVFFAEDSPETAIYPRRQYNGENWLYTAKIGTLQDHTWLALVTASGKVGIREFVPESDTQLTLNIYALTAPDFAAAEGGYTAVTALPAEVIPFVNRAVIQADGQYHADTDLFVAVPAYAVTKIYFTEGDDKWALSAYYFGQD